VHKNQCQETSEHKKNAPQQELLKNAPLWLFIKFEVILYDQVPGDFARFENHHLPPFLTAIETSQ